MTTREFIRMDEEGFMVPGESWPAAVDYERANSERAAGVQLGQFVLAQTENRMYEDERIHPEEEQRPIPWLIDAQQFIDNAEPPLSGDEKSDFIYWSGLYCNVDLVLDRETGKVAKRGHRPKPTKSKAATRA